MEALRRGAKSRDAPGEALDSEDMERFLDSLRARGLAADTVAKYRWSLLQLYDFLPPDKCLGPDTLLHWRTAQLAAGRNPKTVNSALSAANSLLDYLGRRDLQIGLLPVRQSPQPELTRTEYLRLLQMAKLLEKERLYLMVKVFGSMGVSVQELPELTVEAVREGAVTAPGGRRLQLPECLREELLDYARREGIRQGPVFVTRSGRLLNRSNITREITLLCREARVDEAKGNPRCLRKLCLTTQADIQAQLDLLARQTYDHLLETEQAAVGWGIR